MRYKRIWILTLLLAKGDVEAGYNIFHNIYSAFDKIFGKSFKIPAVGKDRQEIELLLKTFDRYNGFPC